MSKIYTLAVDAMGGDNAPNAVFEAVAHFLKKTKRVDVRFHLFGQLVVMQSVLAKFPQIVDHIQLFHCDDVIAGDAKASNAIRQGRQSSLWHAISHVKEGHADAIVSAGNTGILMAMSKLIFRTLEGVRRPAIVTTMPTIKGKTVMLDLGANSECDSHNLIEFALIGSLYARANLGLSKPTVGLLNIGEEYTKGNDTLRDAYSCLKDAPNMPFEFYGFVEGNDILQGTTDVVVTDGFTGNVALKTVEGTAKFMKNLLTHLFKYSWASKLAYLLIKPSLKVMSRKIDPREYSGAVFAGLNGLSVKTHGGSDKKAFANAFSYALNLIESDFNQKVKAAITEHACNLKGE